MVFYKCNHCGNIITHLHNERANVVCCGEAMIKLQAGSTDAATEKHVPHVSVSDNMIDVVVGEVTHPMLDEHFIEFIALENTSGVQIKYLKPGDKPEASFILSNSEKAIAVYEYCNLHGLWKKEL